VSFNNYSRVLLYSIHVTCAGFTHDRFRVLLRSSPSFPVLPTYLRRCHSTTTPASCCTPFTLPAQVHILQRVKEEIENTVMVRRKIESRRRKTTGRTAYNFSSDDDAGEELVRENTTELAARHKKVKEKISASMNNGSEHRRRRRKSVPTDSPASVKHTFSARMTRPQTSPQNTHHYEKKHDG